MSELELIHSYDDKAHDVLLEILDFLISIKEPKARLVQAGALMVSILNLTCKTNEERAEFLLNIALAAGKTQSDANQQTREKTL